MEKSWETLSDPVIHAEGSWALGRFGRLFPSGEVSVEEGESLLLVFLGFHSLCYNTTPFIKINFLKNPFRSSRMLVCNQYVWECFIVDAEKQGC